MQNTTLLPLFIGIHILSFVVMGVILFEYRRVRGYHAEMFTQLGGSGLNGRAGEQRILAFAYILTTLAIVAVSGYVFSFLSTVL